VAKGVYTVKGYLMMMKFLRENYQRASTRIRNSNIPMLKLAMSAGFLVNGIDAHPNGETYLHLWNEFIQ
jgi:hypothetical protein